MNKKGELVWDTLVPWIIGAVVLMFGIILIFLLRGKDVGAIEYVKNVLRIGRA